MNRYWTRGDAWYRRDVGDGLASLTVSRTAGGTWTWRMGTSVTVLAKGSAHSCAQDAMSAADEHLVLEYGLAVSV